MPKSEGLFEVLERINDNGYKIVLGDKRVVSATFNIGNIAPYLEHEEVKITPFEEEEYGVKSVQEHSKDIILAKSFEESSFDSYGLYGIVITSLALTCISRFW